MLRWLRRILAVVAILIALSVLLPLAYIEGTCRPSSGAAAANAPAVTLPAIDEPGYRRKLNNTFFTFPEWYIVYSFEDFGRFLDRSSESHFGYLGHIFGFWRSFCTINRAVPATGESLTEVKTMIYIIGVSYSVEYAIKGLYENSIGRITEWIRGSVRTPQDETQATKCPMLKKEHGKLDFSQSAAAVHNRVRGTNPWPGAYALLDCEPLKIHKTSQTDQPIGDEPVGILKGNAKLGLFVRCADGWLEIDTLQATGGKRLNAKDYLLGRSLEGKVLI
jgi:hypothetical protein